MNTATVAATVSSQVFESMNGFEETDKEKVHLFDSAASTCTSISSCSTVSCTDDEIQCQDTSCRNNQQFISKLDPSLLLPSLSSLSLKGGQEQEEQETENSTSSGIVRDNTIIESTTTKDLEKSSDNKTLPKEVSFGSVTIRQYPIIVGNHPETREGPPLTIDWEYVSEKEVLVDEFEQKHPSSSRRRGENNLRLSWYQRRMLLLSLGFTHREIMKGILDSQEIRTRRHQTLKWLKLAKIEEKCQCIVRHIGRQVQPKKYMSQKLITRY